MSDRSVPPVDAPAPSGTKEINVPGSGTINSNSDSNLDQVKQATAAAVAAGTLPNLQIIGKGIYSAVTENPVLLAVYAAASVDAALSFKDQSPALAAVAAGWGIATIANGLHRHAPGRIDDGPIPDEPARHSVGAIVAQKDLRPAGELAPFMTAGIGAGGLLSGRDSSAISAFTRSGMAMVAAGAVLMPTEPGLPLHQLAPQLRQRLGPPMHLPVSSLVQQPGIHSLAAGMARGSDVNSAPSLMQKLTGHCVAAAR